MSWLSLTAFNTTPNIGVKNNSYFVTCRGLMGQGYGQHMQGWLVCSMVSGASWEDLNGWELEASRSFFTLIWLGVKGYLSVVLISISLMAQGAEYLFMSLSAICICSLLLMYTKFLIHFRHNFLIIYLICECFRPFYGVSFFFFFFRECLLKCPSTYKS